jgi:predicted dehydrogenase
MADKIRWGILGTGAIARKFADGLTHADGAQLLAVGSRSQHSADAFGAEYDIPHCHASYEQLAGDADVDVVYVATPHTLHKKNTCLCLDAGKAVLCEKPFAINAAEASAMVDVAREKNLLLMEAMWTRFLPAMVKLRQMLADGAIGEVQMVTADFGFRTPVNPTGRLFNRALGGGALLDIGVYAVSLASMVIGTPSRATGLAQIGSTGVDEQAGMVLANEAGQLAVLHTAIRTSTPGEARILGTDGSIAIPAFWHADKLILHHPGKKPEVVHLPFKGNGYAHEADEAMGLMRAGRTESEVMGLDESLGIMRTMDSLRAQWGLSYPGEAEPSRPSGA